MSPSTLASEGSGTLGYLGRGIYDIKEVARLIQSGRTRVEAWTRSHRDEPPLLAGELDGLFSFWDLLSLRVIADLVGRGVPRDHIARGAKHIAETFGTNRPFAHRDHATVGVGFLAKIADDWEDAGLLGHALASAMARTAPTGTSEPAQYTVKFRCRRVRR